MPHPAAVAAALGACGLAAVSICIVIYVIVQQNKPKKIAYTSDSTVRHNNCNYTYDPETKSIVESAAPVSKNPDSNLRKRHVERNSSSDNKNEGEKSFNKSIEQVQTASVSAAPEKKVISTVAKEVQTDPIDMNQTDINQNVNDMKGLPDKILPTMSVEERVFDYINNIPATNPEDSESDTISDSVDERSDSSGWSNISEAKSTDDFERAYKKKLHKSLKKYLDRKLNVNCNSRSDQNIDENSDSSSSLSTSSSWSNVSSENSNDDFEKIYKKKIYKSFKKFVKNMNNTETSNTPSECSSAASDISVCEEANECYVCETNPVNTHAVPCKHRYLCSDCSMKYFKLCKKCKVCRTKIEQIVVED